MLILALGQKRVINSLCKALPQGCLLFVYFHSHLVWLAFSMIQDFLSTNYACVNANEQPQGTIQIIINSTHQFPKYCVYTLLSRDVNYEFKWNSTSLSDSSQNREMFMARRLSLLAIYNHDVHHALFWSLLKVDTSCSKVLCSAKSDSLK